MGRVEGRVAIITGAAQGIGASYARALAKEGAKIVIADILDGEPLVKELTANGHEAIFVKTDVRHEAETLALAEKAVERFGKIDILISNAAIYASLELKPFTEIDVNEWDKVMAVNVRGPFLCARAVVPYMRKNGWGRIVNISSGTVFKGTTDLIHYVSSKGAIVAFTRSLAREVGTDGICVNTLAPGLVLSEKVLENQGILDAMSAPVLAGRSIKRDQLPEDLIGPLLFLASEDSAFTTGQMVVVDGGSVMN
jgi:NAD(P)-dependent dehydrogenase (short-subunit alcohol dehydrogenase family)